MANSANYCYNDIPFVLQNASITYQRIMKKIFENQVGIFFEIYMNDIIFKSKEELGHVFHLKESFFQG